MDALRLLVIFVLLAIAVSGEYNREGRCGGGGPVKARKTNNFNQRQTFKKPFIYNRHTGHKFSGSGKGNPMPQQQHENIENEHQQDNHESVASAETSWNGNEHQNTQQDHNAKQLPAHDISPRITISEDGDISFGRSLNFNKLKTFHAEDDSEHRDHDHDIMGEDHDHIHKSLRTARNVLAFRNGWQQGNMGGWQPNNMQGAQGIYGTQGAQSWSYGDLNGSGGQIVYGESGTSTAEGGGQINAVGITSATSGGGSNGWRSVGHYVVRGNGPAQLGATLGGMQYGNMQGFQLVSGNQGPQSTVDGAGTISATGVTSATSGDGGRSVVGDSQAVQGISAGQGAQAGEYLDATLSGLAASLESSGSSSTSGSGTISASGTTTINNSGSGSGGWRSPSDQSGLGSGSGTGVSAGSSGSSGVSGSGTIAATGTTNVQVGGSPTGLESR